MLSEHRLDRRRQAREVEGCSLGVRGHRWGTPGTAQPLRPGHAGPCPAPSSARAVLGKGAFILEIRAETL